MKKKLLTLILLTSVIIATISTSEYQTDRSSNSDGIKVNEKNDDINFFNYENTTSIELNSEIIKSVNYNYGVNNNENDYNEKIWNFPIICTCLYPIIYFSWIMFLLTKSSIFRDLYDYIEDIGDTLDCWW